MKNRIILGSVAVLLMATTLAGCNSGKDATMTNLANQLDKTNNSIQNVKTLSDTDLDVTEELLDKLATQNQSENVQKNINIAKNTLNCERNCKNEVLRKTAKIKNYLSKNDLKLAKNQISALKSLSKNLSKYNNSISYSEKEFNTAINHYNNMKKSINKNPERANAKLNSITCNSNARCAYYENILNTLDQVENVLNIENYNPYQDDNYNYFPLEEKLDDGNENLIESDENIGEEYETAEKPKKKRFKKNIDTYLNDEDKEKKEIEKEFGNKNFKDYNLDTYAPTKRNIDTYRPYYPYGNNYRNGYMGMYGQYGQTPYMPYGTPYNAPINNGSPYGYNANNFNRVAQFADTEEVEKVDKKDDEKLNEKEKTQNFDEKIAKNLKKSEKIEKNAPKKDMREIEKEPRLEEFENKNEQEVSSLDVEIIGNDEEKVVAHN